MLTRAKISSCFYKKKEFEERSVAADFLRGQRCRRSARLSIQLLNEGHVSGFGLNPEILLGAHLERQTVSYGIALGIAAIEDIDLGSCMGIIEQKNEVRRTKHHNSSIRPYKHTSIRNEETEKCDMFCFCTTTFSVMVSWIKKKKQDFTQNWPAPVPCGKNKRQLDLRHTIEENLLSCAKHPMSQFIRCYFSQVRYAVLYWEESTKLLPTAVSSEMLNKAMFPLVLLGPLS